MTNTALSGGGRQDFPSTFDFEGSQAVPARPSGESNTDIIMNRYVTFGGERCRATLEGC
jgi:hypothetical protein